MKCSELWAHPTELDILVASFPDSSFGIVQKKDGNIRKEKKTKLITKNLQQ